MIDEDLPPGAALDWERMVEALERQAPVWEPGSKQGYHAVTFGWLVGEVVRRRLARTNSATSLPRRWSSPSVWTCTSALRRRNTIGWRIW